MTSGLPELDRLLLHTFTSHTATSLSDRPIAQRAWSKLIPHLALSHPFLVKGLLAIGALHLSRLQPAWNAKDAESYHRKSSIMMNQSLPYFRKALESLSDENCHALFTFAACIVVFLFATASDECQSYLASLPSLSISLSDSSSRRKQYAVGSAMLSRHVQAFQATRGSIYVIATHYSLLRAGPCGDIFTRDFWPKEPLGIVIEQARSAALVEDARLLSLQKLWETEPTDIQKILDDTLEDLRWTFALAACIAYDRSEAIAKLSFPTAEEYHLNQPSGRPIVTDRSAILAFPTQMMHEFVELIIQHHKPALLLLSHYAVLFGRVGNMWWGENTGKYIAIAIALVLGRGSRDWLEWPVAFFDLEELWADDKPNHDNLGLVLPATDGTRFQEIYHGFIEQSMVPICSDREQ